jgi:hypothetical protein
MEGIDSIIKTKIYIRSKVPKPTILNFVPARPCHAKRGQSVRQPDNHSGGDGYLNLGFVCYLALARPANPFASPTSILAGTGNL